MPELNPVTRSRLWYIAIFLLLDTVVACYIGSILPPLSEYALPATIFGLLTGVGVAALVPFLLVTRKKEVNLREARDRV